jgi:flagellar biogenesis protein FliO
LSADFERLTRAVDRLAAVAETTSDLATRERAAVLDAVRGERIVVLDAVQKERIATLHEIEGIAQRLADRPGPSLQKDLIALLDAVQKERIATLREIEAIAQRLADRSGPSLHDALQTEMKELLKTVEEMRKRLIVEAGENLERVADHIFFRLVQLLLICAGLVALGLLLRSFLLRRRGRGRQPSDSAR